ncbi:cysteine--tRNA ligase, partial [Paracoccus sp. PXZ]
AALHEMAGQGDAPALLAGARMLGLLTEDLGGWIAEGPDLSALAGRMTALRIEAKASKDFSAVDALKKRLIDAGVEVRMSAAGVELLPGPDFDAAKLPE